MAQGMRTDKINFSLTNLAFYYCYSYISNQYFLALLDHLVRGLQKNKYEKYNLFYECQLAPIGIYYSVMKALEQWATTGIQPQSPQPECGNLSTKLIN